MPCPRCEGENPPDARFCIGCGQPLAALCPSCGSPNASDAHFCQACGHAFAAAAAPVELRSASPRFYTPPHLAEKILTSRSALEGERKQVTVLFADLKGSMELLADRDPEEARKLLDPVLERMMEAVHHYEGTVNQVMGDGLMALFGAPLAHEDHAVRACYAALAIQQAIRQYTEDVRRADGPSVQIRVGLHSGEVVVRSIGNDLRTDYTAVGQTTHVAARMEQEATPGGIWLTAQTLRLVQGFVEVKALGAVRVKGLLEPVHAFELVGAKRSTRWQIRASRGLNRFVGRQAELEAITGSLEKAEAGQGQVVALIGEPGIGKSRLFWELAHSERAGRWNVLETGTVSYGKSTPYLPVADLLKAYFRIDAGDKGDAIRNRVAEKLRGFEPSVEGTLSVFLDLLEVVFEDPAWRALDASQRRQRTLEAVKTLLVWESRRQPLLLVIEDLHWIDTETQALLDSLVESAHAAPLLLLVTYRPEYRHSWASKPYYLQLTVEPLSAASVAELLDTLLGGDPKLAPLKQTLIGRTEGNPFFLEESVRTLVETGALAGEPGAYRLAKGPTSIQVPATVHAVLSSRIDRLGSEEKRLLQTAAVIGKDVSSLLLQVTAELPEEAMRQYLPHLLAAEFLYEKHLFPELEYTFTHALTHEVAYQSLLQDRRRALHARIMQGIEHLYAGRLIEHVDRLAHHALLGEAWVKALTYLRQAGVKAGSRSAHRQAVACFEQALGALQQLPKTREMIEHSIDLRLYLGTSLVPIGELGRVLEHLREAETLAHSIADESRLARVSSFLTHYFWLAGSHERAVEHGRLALDLAERIGDAALQVRSNLFLGQAYTTLGEFERALEVLRKNVHFLQGDLIGRRFGLAGLPSVLSRTWLVWALAEQGEFASAIHQGKEQVQIAEAANHPLSLISGYFGLGSVYLRKGELETAIQTLEHALDLCRTWDDQLRLMFYGVAPSLGYAYALAGRVAAGIPLLEEALEQAASIGHMQHRSLATSWLGEAHLLAGRLDLSRRLAQRALELGREHKERGNVVWSLRLLGDVAARSDPPEVEQAENAYREAIALAAALGMRPLSARARLGLGQVYERAGKLGPARDQLVAAASLFGEMDMPIWVERTEALLRRAFGVRP